MKSRPRSVTVISWLLIVKSVFCLIAGIGVVTSQDPRITEAMQATPLPVPLQYAFLFGGMIVLFVSGVGMLKGFNWARILYVGWTTLALATDITINPQKLATIPGLTGVISGMLMGGILFLIIVYFLFRPAANEWFQGKEST